MAVKRDWIGPWQQWWWSGLHGPEWEWQRAFVDTRQPLGVERYTIAIVSPDGEYSEMSGYMITSARPRKDWIERYGTPDNLGTKGPD